MSTCLHYQPKTADGGHCAIHAADTATVKNVMVGERYCRRCPKYAGPPRGLGDMIHSVAKPIAQAIGSDCLDENKAHLKPDSPCQKMRETLNEKLPIGAKVATPTKVNP